MLGRAEIAQSPNDSEPNQMRCVLLEECAGRRVSFVDRGLSLAKAADRRRGEDAASGAERMFNAQSSA